MKQTTLIPVVVVSCILVLLCCLCAVIVLAGAVMGGSLLEPDAVFPNWLEPTAVSTPVVVRPDALTDRVPVDTLETLKNTTVPINDLADLAVRLGGKEAVPETLPSTNIPLRVGERETFWVTNTDTNESFQIEAVLRYVTDHAYIWIEDGVDYSERELKELGETFENQIYPTNREFFGSEWSPGVDEDPRLYIIFARGLGKNLAGYFTSSDEYHPLAHEYSNAHETFMLNADSVDLGDEYTFGVLAHEFQHMIHWYQDRNEASWLNEGFSELASFLNGYDPGGFDILYTNQPDLQLNDWPNDPSQTSPHYGASFLFLTYFLDRFGEQATRALVRHPDNGLDSVDAVLSDLGAVDAFTGQVVNADDVFLDWALANYLQDAAIADGRYAYYSYAGAPATQDTEVISDCPTEMQTRDVHQYGVDYIRFDCTGAYTLRFEGSVAVGVLPEDPRGEYAFWSNKGDESDMTLTRSFDFRDYDGPLTLTYWTWYDIEEDYDYVYLEISPDEGDTWQILTTPSGTAEDPSGNSYGWAYNGLSGSDGSWIQETVDLSAFAGQRVLIRFEYVTDAAINGEGFLLDDVAIPEIGYFTDFERDSGGWEAAGFVRIRNVLPQTFRLALIEGGGMPRVTYFNLSPENLLEFPVQLNGDTVLVVTGTTRYTRQKASYRFQVAP